MTQGAFTADIRVLLCPRCGAPASAPTAGGELRCGYCQTVSLIRPREDARVGAASPLSPEQERARIQRLWLQAQQGAEADPYSIGGVISDVAHLDKTPAPAFDAAWQEAWNRAVALLQESPSTINQRRVYWLAATTQSSLPAGAWDPRRKRAVTETALELLPDPGYRQMCRQMLFLWALRDGDVVSAERWLSGCDPAPGYLSIDSDYRIPVAMLQAARGEWKAVVTTLGRRPEDLPFDPPVRMLCDCYRAHALDALGDEAEAMQQFAKLVRQSPESVTAIMARHASVSLCQKLQARMRVDSSGAAAGSPAPEAQRARPQPSAAPQPAGLAPSPGLAPPSRSRILWVAVAVGAIAVVGVVVLLVVGNGRTEPKHPTHAAPHAATHH